MTIIKPNRRETEAVTGIKIVQPADALEAGKQLCKRLDAKMALITLDRDGMLLVEQSGHGDIFPTQARSGLRHHGRRRHGDGHGRAVPGVRHDAPRTPCGWPTSPRGWKSSEPAWR